eukprot:CAMPEP_0173183826 /NCGR_PEP_ID=MMETSP1141-20130122/8611_1 /TAXON_ID=483371 /ORGANISM="non described non described, Strain CCMP2298" /LENGTH=45 /DNA_ID= /DNA_START= /DNA_END= /DNA_ORIENTATION=
MTTTTNTISSTCQRRKRLEPLGGGGISKGSKGSIGSVSVSVLKAR